MQIKETQREDVIRHRVEVRAEIVDAEPRSLPYRRDGRLWRPSMIIVNWSRARVRLDPWSVWRGSATVIGPHIRKDGSDAQVDNAERYVRPDHPEWGEWIRSTRPADDSGEA